MEGKEGLERGIRAGLKKHADNYIIGFVINP